MKWLVKFYGVSLSLLLVRVQSLASQKDKWQVKVQNCPKLSRTVFSYFMSWSTWAQINVVNTFRWPAIRQILAAFLITHTCFMFPVGMVYQAKRKWSLITRYLLMKPLHTIKTMRCRLNPPSICEYNIPIINLGSCIRLRDSNSCENYSFLDKLVNALYKISLCLNREQNPITLTFT